MCKMSCCFCLLVLLICRAECEDPLYQIQFFFERYNNPSGLLSNGDPCDQDGSGCDPEITIRLTTAVLDNFSCMNRPFISVSVQFYPGSIGTNVKSVNFSDVIGTGDEAISNPLSIIHPRLLDDQLRLFVQISDDDPGQRTQLIDKINIPIQPAFVGASVQTQPFFGLGTAYNKSLELSYSFACAPNYYGSNCEVLCMARNDSAGHYTCDPVSGEQVCLSGYQDPATNCTESSDPCVGSSTTVQEILTSAVHSNASSLVVRTPSSSVKSFSCTGASRTTTSTSGSTSNTVEATGSLDGAAPYIIAGVLVGLIVITGVLIVIAAVLLSWKKLSSKQNAKHSNYETDSEAVNSNSNGNTNVSSGNYIVSQDRHVYDVPDRPSSGNRLSRELPVVPGHIDNPAYGMTHVTTFASEQQMCNDEDYHVIVENSLYSSEMREWHQPSDRLASTDNSLYERVASTSAFQIEVNNPLYGDVEKK